MNKCAPYLNVICLLIAICSFQSAHSQITNVKLQQISVEQGLPYSTVRSVRQDQFGYLWIVLQSGGICRYDGTQFTLFNFDYKKPASLSSNEAQKVLVDHHNEIWVATHEGLNKFDRQTQSFKKYLYDPAKPNTISGSNVLSLHQDRLNRLWIGTSSGFCRYDSIADEFVRYPRHFKVNNIRSDSLNQIWLATSDGLHRFTPETGRFKVWRHNPNDSTTLASDRVNDVYLHSSGKVYVATQKGLYKLNSNTDTCQIIVPASISHLPLLGYNSITEVHSGKLWVSSFANGVYVLDPNKGDVEDIPLTKHLNLALKSLSVRDVFEDKDKNIWIATKFQGLHLYNPQQHRFPHFKPSRVSQANFYNYVISLCVDRKNRVWVGSKRDGFKLFDSEKGAFKTYSYKESAEYNTFKRIECIEATSDDMILLGTPLGLLSFNPDNESIQYFPHSNVKVIFEDSGGTIWVGALNGLWIFDKVTGTFMRPTTEPSIFEEANIEISGLVEGEGGSLWIATRAKGMYVFNPKNKQLSRLTILNSQGGQVREFRSVYKSKSGFVWLGTKGDGLYFLDKNEQIIGHLTVEDGLPNNIVLGFAEDKDGNIWGTTDFGVFRFDVDRLMITNFYETDGLQGYSFEPQAISIGRNGMMAIGGYNGFNYFDPTKVLVDDGLCKDLIITQVKSLAKGLGNNLLHRKAISLPHNHSFLRIEFSQMNFNKPIPNKYLYRLKGLHENWVEISNQNYVSYSNINPGTYVFQIKPVITSTNCMPKASELKVEIRFPWWKTTWAYVVFLFFLVLLGFGLYHIATLRANLKNKLTNAELEMKRSTELNEMKIRFFTNISHELRTPLTLILIPLEKALKKISLPAEVARDLTRAHQAAYNLKSLVDEILDFRKVQVKPSVLQLAKQDIVEFMKYTLGPFQELAEDKHVALEMVFERPSMLVEMDKERLKKIVNNLVSNAFKFTSANGKVTVSVTFANQNELKAAHAKQPKVKLACDFVRISVEDNGKGIAPRDLEHIFERFYQGEHTPFGTGIGLELVKELAEQHHGFITADSILGEGTSFHVFIPVTQDKQVMSNDSTHKAVLSKEVGQLLELHELEAKKHSGPKPQVLVVEDNQELRDYLKLELSTEFNVLEASDGSMALEVMNTENPDVVISDLMMKPMDGLELCSRIKKNVITSHIPIVVLTSVTLDEGMIKAYEFGADSYITKPFDIDVLKTRIWNIVVNRRALFSKVNKGINIEPKEIASNYTDEVFIQKILSIIEKNYQNPDFNVDEFAHDLNMSRSHLFRKLKSLLGQAPSELLYTHRIQQSCQLLTDSNLTIAEIAYKTGFRSPNSFTKTFTKHIGVSPKKYKASNR